MAGLYPSLNEKFKNEGICPICMMSMAQSPKYSCVNGHTVCHRCKPYYYACPTCKSPLEVQIPPPDVGGYHMPPPMHYMPHPYPPYPPPGGNMPSAPFIDNESHSWEPPTPTEDQELKHCGFCYAGCEARFPEHLRRYHESRCSFRPEQDEEEEPPIEEGELKHCGFCYAGCDARFPEEMRSYHERQCSFRPNQDGEPQPVEDEELKHCGFCHAGCEARFPEHLRQLHESRCQFRPNLEEEQLPTDLCYDEENLSNCQYQIAGCNVRLPEWRKRVHEEICIYKDKMDVLEGIRNSLDEFSFDDCGDPEELVDCPYMQHGCQVRMPRRRRHIHQSKCNYRHHHEEEHPCEPEVDPDQPVPCRWADNGCLVKPRHCRRDIHAEKCNYRMENCPYRDYGCDATFQPCRKYEHVRSCPYTC